MNFPFAFGCKHPVQMRLNAEINSPAHHPPPTCCWSCKRVHLQPTYTHTYKVGAISRAVWAAQIPVAFVMMGFRLSFGPVLINTFPQTAFRLCALVFLPIFIFFSFFHLTHSRQTRNKHKTLTCTHTDLTNTFALNFRIFYFGQPNLNPQIVGFQLVILAPPDLKMCENEWIGTKLSISLSHARCGILESMPRGICYFRSVWPTAARADAVSWAVVATVVRWPPKSPTAYDSLCKRTGTVRDVQRSCQRRREVFCSCLWHRVKEKLRVFRCCCKMGS